MYSGFGVSFAAYYVPPLENFGFMIGRDIDIAILILVDRRANQLPTNSWKCPNEVLKSSTVRQWTLR
jgi:hypothetical protein